MFMSALIVTELIIAAGHSEPTTQKLLIALAGRIALCNHADNIWIVKDAYADPNRPPSDAVGRFWRCESKLCPSCLARQSKLTRNKLRFALNSQQLQRDERYSFVTFTIPNPAISLLETRAIVDRAWCLFRKRSWCVASVRGGCKSEEFTLTKIGFHYHLHCIFLTKWFLYNTLRREWTECVEKAYIEAGLEKEWKNYLKRRLEQWQEFYKDDPIKLAQPDIMLNVKIKPTTAGERSIQEVCKYVTKCDSWSKMRRSDLIEVALVARWCRMFELFGCFALRNTQDAKRSLPIVHTESLTDGEPSIKSKTWRETVAENDPEYYLYVLEDKINRQRQHAYRQIQDRFPGKTIWLLSTIPEKELA